MYHIMSSQVLLLSILLIIVVSSVSVSSAALKQEKLSILGQQGYEIISGAEEFLTPVSQDQDNGLRLSNGDKISNKKNKKPDMLLYGKYYVLRKKELGLQRKIPQKNIFNSQDDSVSARNEAASQLLDKFLFDVRTAEGNAKKFSNSGVDDADAIVFPDEQGTVATRKYIRHRKSGNSDNPPDQSGKVSSTTTNSHALETSPTPSPTPIPQPSTTDEINEHVNFDSQEDNLDSLSSDEFVEWAKDNLSLQQISDLLHEEISEVAATDESDTVSDDEEETTTFDPSYPNGSMGIAYNSFILVPGTKCPEGTIRDHRNSCSPLRKISSSTLSNSSRIRFVKSRRNARRKLEDLVSTLKALEEDAVEAVDALKKDENESTTDIPRK